MPKKRIIMGATAVIMMLGCILLYYMTIYGNHKSQATWLWNASAIEEDPEQILGFLEREQVTKLYVQVDSAVSFKSYRSFIKRADRRGIEVHALGGAPDWAAEPASLEGFFAWVEDYQGQAGQDERFSGVHLDIEPYLLPEWERDQADIIENFQQRIRSASLQSHHLNLPLGIDIPFWFDQQEYANSHGKGLLSEWLIDRTDEVTVMAYRNQAKGKNGIIRIAENEIAYGEKSGKKVWIGVETSPSNEGGHLSFHGKSSADMEKQLGQTRAAFRFNKHFGGIAVHSLESWMNMKE